ncbi:MAG: elongation factor P [Chitinispirillaceae bacterium]|jgi:elongation factor P|nr:elongation factor P [Chitinispirillaceae bacterium]
MGSVDTSQFRKKLKLILDDGQPWVIVENDFVKPGKGQAFNRTKFKNLITGRVLDKTFRSGEVFQEADISAAQMQYLYTDGHAWTFMNTKDFEQVEVQKDIMEDAVKWIRENDICEVQFWGERVISVIPPTFVDLTVTYTEPAVRGDTANSVTKKATLETGAEIDVPMFIDSGTKIKIDTRTGEYLQRTT